MEDVVIKKEQMMSKEVKSKYLRLPALSLSEDVVIYETTAIARHLARNHGLYKGDDAHMAQIDSWMELIKSEVFEKAYDGVIFPILGHKPYTNKSFADAMATFKSFLPRLNKIENYLVGPSLTIADLYAAAMLHLPFGLVIDEGMHKSFAKLNAWFLKVTHEPAYVEFFGIPRFCKVALKPILPPTEELMAHKASTDGAKEPEKAKTKDKPKDGAEAKDGEEDDDAPKKKPPNPLDILPPSPFSLDDFKREFLANKTQPTRRAYIKEKFWSKFDPNGWAIWYVDYIKAEGEGDVLYKTSNLLAGFLYVLLSS